MFLKLSSITQGGATSLFLDLFKATARENVALVETENTTEQERRGRLADEFATRTLERIKSVFFEPITAKKYAVAFDFDEDATQSDYVNALRSLAGCYANRVFTAPAVLAWVKAQDTYAPDFNGKTETETETLATGTSEQTNAGTSKQKFSTGVFTASAGTANASETSETQNALTTGTTKQKTTQGYAHEYAGNVEAFADVNLQARNIVERTAQRFFDILISTENLFSFEIIEGVTIN